MAVTYTTDFTTPKAYGPLSREYPFELDSTAIIYSQLYWVQHDSYTPPTLDEPHPTKTTAYCTGDYDFQDVQPWSGLLQYRREWCTIPQGYEDQESILFEYPGIDIDPDAEAVADLSALGYNEETVTVYSQSQVNALRSDPTYLVTAVKSSTSFAFFGGGYRRFAVSFYRTDPSRRAKYIPFDRRRPMRKRVTATRYNKFFLPGVSTGIQSVSDIPLLTAFSISNPDTINTDTYDGYVWALSTPSGSDYVSWVLDEREIVAEDTDIQRWRGNIHIARTLMIPAK